MTQALGRYDFTQREGQKMHVAPDQCLVQAAEDGSSIYVYAQGQTPTGWRTSPYEPWVWMQPGESVALSDGNKVSLDYNDPESAVFKFEKANGASTESNMGSVWGGGGGLPAGWIEGTDEGSGQTYYYNEQTGATQWDRPM